MVGLNISGLCRKHKSLLDIIGLFSFLVFPELVQGTVPTEHSITLHVTNPHIILGDMPHKKYILYHVCHI